MKGWTKDGTEVDLTPEQALIVRMLLGRDMTVLPGHPRGGGWSTALATAARMDAEGIDPGRADPREVRQITDQWVTRERLRNWPQGLRRT